MRPGVKVVLGVWSLVGAVSLWPSCRTSPEGLAVAKRTASGSGLRWKTSEVVLRHAPEYPGGRVHPLMVQSLGRAATIWNDALSECGKTPRLIVSKTPLERPGIRDDAINEVLFHSREWCPPGAVDDDECYDRTVHASTRLRPELRPGHASDGELREADLEVNGVQFDWSLHGETRNTLNLEALLVHELGHMLGLDHPCAPPGSPARKAGIVSVSCNDRRVQQAVMHPFAASKLINRAVKPLRAEIAVICDRYNSAR